MLLRLSGPLDLTFRILLKVNRIRPESTAMLEQSRAEICVF